MQVVLLSKFGKDKFMLKIKCKIYILYYLIRDCHLSFLLKNLIHPITSNNISINS